MRPLLAEIPRAALAAVIVSAAIAIIDVAGYRSLWRVSREEFVLAVVAALGVIMFGVLVGVLRRRDPADRRCAVPDRPTARRRPRRPPDADGWVDVGPTPKRSPSLDSSCIASTPRCSSSTPTASATASSMALAESPGNEEWLVLDFEGVGCARRNRPRRVGRSRRVN